MSDRDEIIELTSNLGLLVDASDWPAVRALFSDPVEVDYTSLNGGEPQTVAPADLVGGWAEMLDRLEATQHLIANQVVVIDGDAARAAANVTATHVAPGGSQWVVGGRYDFGVRRASDGWRIAALTLTVAWQKATRGSCRPSRDADGAGAAPYRGDQHAGQQEADAGELKRRRLLR
jgi:ketosteroid isomerase-like protein